MTDDRLGNYHICICVCVYLTYYGIKTINLSSSHVTAKSKLKVSANSQEKTASKHTFAGFKRKKNHKKHEQQKAEKHSR